MKTPVISLGLLAGFVLNSSAQDPAAEVAKAKLINKVAATTSNLKRAGMALFEFDSEYGAFPNPQTAAAVKKATGSQFKFEGKTSNDYLRQLIVGMPATKEGLFQMGDPAKPADEKVTTEEEALAKGECDFAYLPGATSSTEPGRPLLVVPMVPGKMEFDPKPLGGKALVLQADMSVLSLPINEKGEVIVKGKSFFDPTQEYWDGKKPEVAWPIPGPAAPAVAEKPATLQSELEKAKMRVKVSSTELNLKKLGAVLGEFASEHDIFPSQQSVKKVQEATKTTFKFEGKTSNDYFRQLLVGPAGIKEDMFQVGMPAKPADNKFATEEEALAKGECDFAYVPGSTFTTDQTQPDMPLVIFPLVPGKLEFDPAPLAGQALVLQVDMSVLTLPINDKGEVIVKGKSFFDPAQSFWKGKKPEVAWPK